MIRLSSVSATYSVPFAPSATPVGPIASAVLSSTPRDLVRDDLLAEHLRRLPGARFQADPHHGRVVDRLDAGVGAAVQHVADEQRRRRSLRDRRHVPRALDVACRRSSRPGDRRCRARSGSRPWRSPTCRWSSAGCRRRRSRPAGCSARSSGRRRRGRSPGATSRRRREQRAACRPASAATIVVPVPWLFDLALKLLTRKLPAFSVPTLVGTMVTSP